MQSCSEVGDESTAHYELYQFKETAGKYGDLQSESMVSSRNSNDQSQLRSMVEPLF